MKKYISSLYARISGLYLVLLLALCMICVAVFSHYFNLYMAAVEQQVNADLAAHLAAQLAPELQSGIDADRLTEAVRRITAINPSLELYILDGDGNILSYFQTADHIQRGRVALAPVRAFLDKDARYPIFGDDPCHPEARNVFSSVPVSLVDISTSSCAGAR